MWGLGDALLCSQCCASVRVAVWRAAPMQQACSWLRLVLCGRRADCSAAHTRSQQSPGQASFLLLSARLSGSRCPLLLGPRCSCRLPCVAVQPDPVTSVDQSEPVNRRRLLLFHSYLLRAVTKCVLLYLQPNEQLSP